MNTTFTWSIQRLACIPQFSGKQNVVIQIEWACRARADINGKVFVQDTFGTHTPGQYDPHADFIEFSNLTEADVHRWMIAEGLNKQATEDRLQALLDEQINPPVLMLTPPWLITRV